MHPAGLGVEQHSHEVLPQHLEDFILGEPAHAGGTQSSNAESIDPDVFKKCLGIFFGKAVIPLDHIHA